MRSLTSEERRELRARAHHLHPVAAVGRNGLTEAVLLEIDVALRAHELVKVRVADEDRHARASLAPAICEALDCALVQHLGKLLILWRPRPAEAEAKPPAVRRPKAPGPQRSRPGGPRANRRSAGSTGMPGDGTGAPRANRRSAGSTGMPGDGKPPARVAGDQSRRRRRIGEAAPAAVPRAPAARRRRRLV